METEVLAVSILQGKSTYKLIAGKPILVRNTAGCLLFSDTNTLLTVYCRTVPLSISENNPNLELPPCSTSWNSFQPFSWADEEADTGENEQSK